MAKTKAPARTDDVLEILDLYEREHHVVAFRRTRCAINALKPFFRDKRASEIDVPLCRQYIAFRMGEGVAIATAARELTTLRAACNHAIKWKRFKGDMPVFEVPADLPKREIWLFKDELRILLDFAIGDVKAFIQIAYETASRRRAVEEMEWYQCSFNRRTISLAKRDEPKTNKRRPVVPMGNVMPVLRDLYDRRTNEWVLGSNRDLLYEFTKTCEAAGLLNVPEREGRPAGRITPHVLRHSRATHLLEDGVSIYAVAKLLGDSVTTVQKTYGHICMSSLEDELSKSGGVL